MLLVERIMIMMIIWVKGNLWSNWRRRKPRTGWYSTDFVWSTGRASMETIRWLNKSRYLYCIRSVWGTRSGRSSSTSSLSMSLSTSWLRYGSIRTKLGGSKLSQEPWQCNLWVIQQQQERAAIFLSRINAKSRLLWTIRIHMKIVMIAATKIQGKLKNVTRIFLEIGKSLATKASASQRAWKYQRSKKRKVRKVNNKIIGSRGSRWNRATCKL